MVLYLVSRSQAFSNFHCSDRYLARRKSLCDNFLKKNKIMWIFRGEFTNKSETTLKLGNWNADDHSSEAFLKICFNASTVSRFDPVLLDPLTKFKSLLLFQTGNSVRNYSAARETLMLLIAEINWTLFLSNIGNSSKYFTDPNKTAAFFCDDSIHYHFHASVTHTRNVLGFKKQKFWKTAVLILIVHNCRNKLLPIKSFCPSFFLESSLKNVFWASSQLCCTLL